MLQLQPQIPHFQIFLPYSDSIREFLPWKQSLLNSNKIGFATQTALQSYTSEFKKKAQEEKDRYIDLVKKSIKDIIKDEVKSQLPRILPKEVSDFATLVIQSAINESLENVILAKSSSQPKSTYEDAASLTKFELKKILLDKIQKNLFESYGNTYSLKINRDDKDQDEDPPAGSDQGLKKRKTSKDVEPPKGSKSKESKSSSSKGSKSQLKSSGKSGQAEEPVPPTPDRDWNAGKHIDFRPPLTLISKMAKVRKHPTTFDELLSTPIDFLAYVLHNLKIENLTQEHLVGPAFNLLKGTCKSRVELEFHFEECYKDVTDKLDWTNPEGHEYPFDLSKPLPLIEDQGRQVVPANYFFNNDLEYLKGGSLSSKYTTSTTKTKAAKYDTIEGIEDMVPSLWSPMKVTYYKYAMGGISHWGLKRQSFYGYASNRKSKHDVFSTK
ncbi:hypothetical protein Tco_1009975 [Tanacetum coccineum]